MRKAFFLAIGVTALIYGLEFLGTEKMMLKTPGAPAQRSSFFDVEAKVLGQEFVPPAWSPWSLIAGGAVTCLYCFTIPRRLGG